MRLFAQFSFPAGPRWPQASGLIRTLGALLFLCCLAWGLAGCAGMGKMEPVKVTVAGIDGLSGHGLEARFAVKLRLQNPNDVSFDYDGVSLDLSLNGKPVASGVSADKGTLPRFGETVITVNLSVSTLAVLRQAATLVAREHSEEKDVPYEIKGKLGGGLFGPYNFHQSGTLAMPR